MTLSRRVDSTAGNKTRSPPASTSRRMKRTALLLGIIYTAVIPIKLFAGLVYWDINGATAGAGGATPTGSWDLVTANWGNSAGNAATTTWNNANGDTAVFAAGTDATGSYTVTLNAGITLAGITREEGGTVTISGATNTLTFTGGALAVDTGTGTVIANVLYAPTGGVITKTGTGLFSTGTVQTSFAGKWVSNAGSLSFPGDTRIGVVPVSLVADQITLNGGNIRSSTATVSFNANRGITLGAAGGGFDHGGTVTLTWAGPITGSAGGALKMLGAGALILSSTANNYDGATTISAGTLRLGASGVIPDTSVVGLTASGATFDLNGFDETVKSISGATGTIALGANTLTINNPASESFGTSGSGGSITGTGGKIVKNGSGSITLQQNTSTYSGGFTLNAGKVGILVNPAFGTGTLTINNSPTIGVGSGTGRSPTNAVDLNGNITFDDSFTATPGTLTWGTGAWTIKGGNRTITVNTAAGGYLATINSVIGQDVPGRGLIKEGNGSLALNNAANTYSGDTTINGGKINLDGDGSLGNGAGTLHLSGGTLNITADRTAVVSNPIDLTADSAITTSSAATSVIVDFSNSTVGGSAGTLTFRNDGADGVLDTFKPRFSGGGFTFSRPVVIDNGGTGKTELNSFNTTGSTQTFSGNISGGGSYRRTASVAGTGGTTIFSGTNTYTGTTSVNDGILQAGSNQAFGVNSAVTLGNVAGATLDLAGFSNSIGSLTGGGGNGGNVTLVAATLTVGGDNTSPAAYAGIISGIGGSLAKVGTGTLTLSGINTFTGTTTIDQGTLTAAGTNTLGSTASVAVNAGGTFLLAGGPTDNRINDSAPVTLNGGISTSATLSMQGLTSASETVGMLTLSGTSTLDFGTGQNNLLEFADLTEISGYSLRVNNWTGTMYPGDATDDSGDITQDRFVFAAGSGLSVGDMFPSISFYNISNQYLGFGQVVNFGSGFEIVPVPEPSAIFGALALFGLAGYRERRRSAALRRASRQV